MLQKVRIITNDSTIIMIQKDGAIILKEAKEEKQEVKTEKAKSIFFHMIESAKNLGYTIEEL